jgi:hypothetical protein
MVGASRPLGSQTGWLNICHDPDARVVVKSRKAWLLHKMGHDDKARRLFAEIKTLEHYRHPLYQFQANILRDWGYGALMG